MRFQQGFIAVTSAIIISILLLSIVFTLSLSGFFVRFNILDSEYKNRSEALAEGCVNKVFLNIEEGVALTTTEPQLDCEILSATLGGGQYTIYTKAVFPATGSMQSMTSLKVVVDDEDLDVITWQELSACDPPSPGTSPCN